MRPCRLCLPVLALVFCLGPAIVAQSTLRVPQDHGSIQLAVDNALSGDTIVVSKGIYAEHVDVIGLTDLTLKGRGKPVIFGTDEEPVPGEGKLQLGGLNLQACSGIKVQGFVIRGAAGNAGITVSSCSDVTIDRCRVEGLSSENGLSIFSSSGVVVDRCRINGVYDGIQVSSSTDVSVSRARIEDTHNDGMQVASSSPVTVTRTRIRRTVGDGLHTSSNSIPSTVSLDRVRMMDIGDDGVQASGPMTDIHLSRTRIDRPGGAGIEASGRAVTLERVVVRQAVGYGYRLTPIAGPDVPTEGLVVSVEGPVDIDRVVVIGAGNTGLHLEANGARVDALRVKRCEIGVQIFETSDALLTDIKVAQCDETGLAMTLAGNTIVRGVRIKGGRTGVNVNGSQSTNLIESVKVSGVELDAFVVQGDGDEYRANSASSSGRFGFVLFGSFNTLTGNRARGSGEADLNDQAGQTNTLIDNNFGTQITG